jgi:hypothetical protein
VTIRRASWWGTALFTATSAGAAAAPETALQGVAFVVAVGLFLAGCGIFAAAYNQAVRRSRQSVIGVTQLFFLTGDSAPADVRRSLLGAFGLQVAVALGAAIARPYSSLAAGTLTPLYGLALCGLWAARHGAFPRREPGDRGD